MKKGVLLIFLSLLVLSVFFVSAETNSTSERAYTCLENKVSENGCSSLSTEEKIFSLLAIGKCKTELSSDSSASECWPSPSSSCKVKTTAQAVLALKGVGADTTKPEAWLLSKVIEFQDIDWFLQVESSNSTDCEATYGGSSHSFSINEDKTIAGSAGSCLSVYSDYWLQISSSCYDEEFQISCDESFLTSLLYKKPSSSTVYVSEKTNSAAAGGTTTEKVNALCFKEGSTCSYEGTLWAALVLKASGKDVSAYIPYLVAFSDENLKYLPESFLYSLTDNFKTDLLASQQESKWWSASGDKYYDTAVALLPFQNEDLTEKTNSQAWLESVQGTDGCWQGNIRNTAFLLYSLWPRTFSTTDDGTDDCADSNYFCMSSTSCSDINGSVLSAYGGCFGVGTICCSKEKPLESCSDQAGELCDSDETCSGGSQVSSSDSNSAKFCCVKGICMTPELSACEKNSGTCSSYCGDKQQSVGYVCGSSSDVCCIAKKTSYVWLIIVLIVLIILAVLGIIYRKQLKEFLTNLIAKIKSKFGKGKGKPSSSQGPGPRFPPSSPQRYPVGAMQRRIMPPQQAQQRPVARPAQQNKSDFDEVMKKLKEIGK